MVEKGGTKVYIQLLYSEALGDPRVQYVLVLAAYPASWPICHKQRSEPHEYIRISFASQKEAEERSQQTAGPQRINYALLLKMAKPWVRLQQTAGPQRINSALFISFWKGHS